MNKIYYLVIAVAALVSFVSCNNDTDLDHKSIFPDGVDKTTQNEFDLWVDAYNELMGRDFLRQYSPRMIQLIGSAEYKEDSSEVLGTAEGGMKIFFNKVNLLDLKKPDMSVIRFYYIKSKGFLVSASCLKSSILVISSQSTVKLTGLAFSDSKTPMS